MTHSKGGYCDRCSHYAVALYDVRVCKQTHWSPAEYERWCRACARVDDDRDEDYERAAANYDGSGKDWR